MKKIITVLFLCMGLCLMAKDLPVHCNNDIAKFKSIMDSIGSPDLSRGQRMVMAAQQLIGAGEDDYYVTDSIGTLRVNLESVTPLMLINNVIALTNTAGLPGNADFGSFEKELVNVACRKGTDTGFPSVMYHGADWIGDNVSRGNIIELTENYSGVVDHTKSLDEMTRYRKNFAALADSATFEAVRMTEMGFRTHRVPYLKKETIKKKEILEDLQDGDIIILVPNRDGIDIYDAGVISMENGIPYLIHLSPRSHEVVKEKDDLARYMSLMTKYFRGYRILRIK